MLSFYIIMGSAIFICLIMAFFLLRGKGSMLISGYNTLPASKRALFDKQKLCKFTGWMMVRVALYLGFLVLGEALGIMPLFWVGVGLLLLDSFYSSFQMIFNKKRFLK